MAVEHSTRMIPSDASHNWPLHMDPINDMSSDEIRALLNLKRQNVSRDPKGTVPSRSGSAPPSFEGSFAAIQNFMEQQNSRVASPTTSSLFDCQPEERLLSDPAYITYYYSHVNLNPRLPPPRLSRENRHLLHINGNRRLSSFEDTALLTPPGFLSTHREEREEDISVEQALNDQTEDCSAFMTRQQPGASLSRYTESMVDRIQDGISRSKSPALTVSHPETAKENVDYDGRAVTLTDHSSHLTELTLGSTNCSVTSSHCLSDPCPSNKSADAEDAVTACSVPGLEIARTDSRMKALNVSDSIVSGRDLKKHEELQFHEQTRQLHHAHQGAYRVQPEVISQGAGSLNNDVGGFSIAENRSSGIKATMQNPELVSPFYAATAAFMNSGSPFYTYLQQASMLHPQFGFGPIRSSICPPHIGGYPSQSTSVMPFDGYTGINLFGQAVATTTPHIGAAQYLNSLYGPYGRALQTSFASTLQGLYEPPLNYISRDLAQYNQMARSQAMWGQKSLTAFAEDTKPVLVENENLSTSGHEKYGVNSSNYYYYGHPNYRFTTQFPVPSPLPPGSPMAATNHSVFGEHVGFSSGSYPETYSGIKGPKASDSTDESKRHYFLELLKSNNSKKLDLSHIAGQIVNFSTDQHGSRFIQQKLDHSSVEDKERVFREVLPHASKLMTDVFGNYVIQKLFEHGNSEQRRKLADQLTGKILSLSLQMYGCRVIQKALDVIELDQKVKLVHELDGHVTRCVSDQNGNHVIQKCIEIIPAKKIAFIISAFHGQVATLSTHPYGCRVIQRVLEHCSEDSVSQCIVDEILESACTLAEDQYGNYVTQHVLEMGKPQERSQIISKLDGKFVQMSQHKYASNVVEKCLKFGDSSERELLIAEIIGPSNDDDNLLAMMKDQYANYVVQRILELASEKQREMFLNRIEHHIPALKKYTFGKHIVARYEKLSSSPEMQMTEQKR